MAAAGTADHDKGEAAAGADARVAQRGTFMNCESVQST